MPRWKIIDGPTQRNVRVDGEVWGYVIENTNDPAQRRFTGVTLSRTVLQSDQARLLSSIREAVATHGASVIEPHLDEQEPPEMFLVTSESIAAEPVV